MSTRLWISIGLAAGATVLAGCVVVPAEPAYGYGPPGPVVRVSPPPVVVAPVPPPRRHYHYYPRPYYRW